MFAMQTKTTLIFLLVVLSSPAFGGAIHKAAETGDLAKVKELIQKNPKLISSVDSSHMTPLHWAVYNDHIDVAEFLLAKGADVKALTFDGYTPLHFAAGRGYKEMAEL